jgi:hypothetical protein
MRLFYLVFQNFGRESTPSTGLGASTLPFAFESTIFSTHTNLFEMDYNVHKSNSTYLSDLDLSRTSIVARLILPGLRILGRELSTPGREDRKTGRTAIVLGAVYCNFQKEILPYTRYHVKSRLLAWDTKWFYIISHFIKGSGSEKGTNAKPAILAIAVSKYVGKKGRWTIPPEDILRVGGFVPQRPGIAIPSRPSTNNLGSTVRTSSATATAVVSEPKVRGRLNENWKVNGTDWSYDQFELERQRGIKAVEAFARASEAFDNKLF